MENKIKDTILIADDDINNLNVIIELLDKSGYKTIVATDGFSAIEKVMAASPDLILLDVMMPGIDGFETCRKLKEIEESKNIPLIFISAFSETLNKIKGFESGGVDFITKPFQNEEVLSRINLHLSIYKFQHEILNKEARFRNTLDNMLDGCHIIDFNYRYLYVNETAEKHLCKTKEELLGNKLTDIYPAIENMEVFQYIKSCIEERVSYKVQSKFDICEDKTFWFNFSIQSVPEGVFILTEDITDQVLTKESLKKTEKQLSDSLKEVGRQTLDSQQKIRILRALLENLPEAIVISEAPDGLVQFANKTYEDFFDISPDCRNMMSIEDQASCLIKFLSNEHEGININEIPSFRALKKGEIIKNEEWKILKKDKDNVVLSVIAAPIYDEKGNITHSIASYRDITENKKIEENLRRNEHQLRTLLDNTPDLIVRYDKFKQYLYANPAYEKITGITKEQLLGKTNKELKMLLEYEKTFDQALNNVLRSGTEASIEFDINGFFGKRYFWGKLMPEFEKNGYVETILLIARDITERRLIEEHIRFLSFHDPVSGLHNRVYFEEEVRRIDNERELPISIIMGDVNNLKITNDLLGHEQGDILINEIGAIFKRACRDNDIIVRWGGDEFVAVLPKTTFSNAGEINSRIREECKKSENLIIRPSISLGLAVKTDRNENIYKIIKDAESLMYENKTLESKPNQDMIIFSLLSKLKEKKQITDEHLKWFENFISEIGKTMGMKNSDILDLNNSFLIHELSKVTIPDNILMKENALDTYELKIMKKHSEAGFRIARALNSYIHLSDIVFSIHEWWNGSGYPKGLKKNEISLLARMLAIFIAYDAMIHDLPYRKALSPGEAISELRSNEGIQFDPNLTELFISAIDSKKNAAKNYQ